MFFNIGDYTFQKLTDGTYQMSYLQKGKAYHVTVDLEKAVQQTFFPPQVNMQGIQVNKYIITPNNDGSITISYQEDNLRISHQIDLGALLDRAITFQSTHLERCHAWFMLATSDEATYLADTDRRQLLNYLPDLSYLPPGLERCSPRVKNLWYLEQFVTAYNKMHDTTLTTQQVAMQGGIL